MERHDTQFHFAIKALPSNFPKKLFSIADMEYLVNQGGIPTVIFGPGSGNFRYFSYWFGCPVKVSANFDSIQLDFFKLVERNIAPFCVPFVAA